MVDPTLDAPLPEMKLVGAGLWDRDMHRSGGGEIWSQCEPMRNGPQTPDVV